MDITNFITVITKYITKGLEFNEAIEHFIENDLNQLYPNLNLLNVKTEIIGILGIKPMYIITEEERILKEYELKKSELFKLDLEYQEIKTINEFLLKCIYLKTRKEYTKYDVIRDDLKNRVQIYKDSVINGTYDTGFRDLFGDRMDEIINTRIGSTQFIVLCDLLYSYLDYYQSNTQELGFNRIKNKLYSFNGIKQDLSLLYKETYNSDLSISSKITFIDYIRNSLFLFRIENKKGEIIEFDREQKHTYEGLCESMSKAAKKANIILSNNEEGIMKKISSDFIEILKEQKVI